jgi:hypothetical protein
MDLTAIFINAAEREWELTYMGLLRTKRFSSYYSMDAEAPETASITPSRNSTNRA